MPANCYVCGFEMIWGGDEVVHDEMENSEMIESSFSCAACKSTALFYHRHSDNLKSPLHWGDNEANTERACRSQKTA